MGLEGLRCLVGELRRDRRGVRTEGAASAAPMLPGDECMADIIVLCGERLTVITVLLAECGFERS